MTKTKADWNKNIELLLLNGELVGHRECTSDEIFLYIYYEDYLRLKGSFLSPREIAEVYFNGWVNGKPNFRYECQLIKKWSDIEIKQLFEANKYVSKKQKNFHYFPDALIKKWTKVGVDKVHILNNELIKYSKENNINWSLKFLFVERSTLANPETSIKRYTALQFIESWLSEIEKCFIEFTNNFKGKVSHTEMAKIYYYLYVSIFRPNKFAIYRDAHGKQKADRAQYLNIDALINVIKGNKPRFAGKTFEDLLFSNKSLNLAWYTANVAMPLRMQPTMIWDDGTIVSAIDPFTIIVLGQSEDFSKYRDAFLMDICRNDVIVVSKNEKNLPICKPRKEEKHIHVFAVKDEKGILEDIKSNDNIK